VPLDAIAVAESIETFSCHQRCQNPDRVWVKNNG